MKILESTYIPVLERKLPTLVEYSIGETYCPFEDDMIKCLLGLDYQSLTDYLYTKLDYEKKSIDFWDLSNCLFHEMTNIGHPDLCPDDLDSHSKFYIEGLEYNHMYNNFRESLIFSIQEVLGLNEEKITSLMSKIKTL